jgi:hypothetical protein
MIARWQGIVKEIHCGGSIIPSTIIDNLYLKKPSFGPSKWPRKLKTDKNSKLPNLPENYFEPVEKGGWPTISTWITHFIPTKEKLVRTQTLVGAPSLLPRKT